VSRGEESAAHERRFIALAYPERIVLLPYNNIAAMMRPFLLRACGRNHAAPFLAGSAMARRKDSRSRASNHPFSNSWLDALPSLSLLFSFCLHRLFYRIFSSSLIA